MIIFYSAPVREPPKPGAGKHLSGLEYRLELQRVWHWDHSLFLGNQTRISTFNTIIRIQKDEDQDSFKNEDTEVKGLAGAYRSCTAYQERRVFISYSSRKCQRFGRRASPTQETASLRIQPSPVSGGCIRRLARKWPTELWLLPPKDCQLTGAGFRLSNAVKSRTRSETGRAGVSRARLRPRPLLIRIFSKTEICFSFPLYGYRPRVAGVFGIRVYVWTVKYDSKTLRVDADLFKYGEKNKVRFWNYAGTWTTTALIVKLPSPLAPSRVFVALLHNPNAPSHRRNVSLPFLGFIFLEGRGIRWPSKLAGSLAPASLKLPEAEAWQLSLAQAHIFGWEHAREEIVCLSIQLRFWGLLRSRCPLKLVLD